MSNSASTFYIKEEVPYHFLLLLEHHFREERSVEFYAEKRNITSKCLNQISAIKPDHFLQAVWWQAGIPPAARIL